MVLETERTVIDHVRWIRFFNKVHIERTFLFNIEEDQCVAIYSDQYERKY